MAESDSLFSASLSSESIKVIAESIGINNLPEDAAREVADDISYRLKLLIQDSCKFMRHSKRQKLLPSDIDNSLKIKNIEPLYGIYSKDHIPFRFASGGGRELFFVEEKDVDLNDIISSQPVKLPLEVTIRSHWMAIDGVQPTIPENPPPVEKELQKIEAIDPIAKLNKNTKEDSSGKPATAKVEKLRNVETVNVKQLATHELSVEQQLYYKEITEACVGSDEARRAEALQSLACDPGLHEMLPRMCTFISEGVKVNVVQHNLALLIYLMRMVKALTDNPALYLEKYLHELIPSVATCIVSKQLCARPEADNHWALRDFASKQMAHICKTFNTSTNNLQTRVTRIFAQAINDEKTPLSSLYGALEGLCELGPEVVKVFILPKTKALAERIDQTTNISDKVASQQIRSVLVKNLTPILKAIRQPPDIGEEYRQEFVSLGPALHSAVCKARLSSQSSPQMGSATMAYSGSELVVSSSSTARTIVVNSIPRQPSQQQSTSQQKYVIVRSTPTSSSMPSAASKSQIFQSQNSSMSTPQSGAIIKMDTGHSLMSGSNSSIKIDSALLQQSSNTIKIENNMQSNNGSIKLDHQPGQIQIETTEETIIP